MGVRHTHLCMATAAMLPHMAQEYHAHGIEGHVLRHDGRRFRRCRRNVALPNMRAKGWTFMGLGTVRMPENYLALFRVPSKDEGKRFAETRKPRFEAFARTIMEGKRLLPEKAMLANRWQSYVTNPLFYAFIVKDKGFWVTSACIGCGMCTTACPLSNITMTGEGRNGTGIAPTAWHASPPVPQKPSNTNTRPWISRGTGWTNENVNIANIITALRIVGCALLFVWPPLSLPFLLVYAWCGISDVLDGALARRFALQSDFGSALDSIADALFVFAPSSVCTRFSSDVVRHGSG